MKGIFIKNNILFYIFNLILRINPFLGETHSTYLKSQCIIMFEQKEVVLEKYAGKFAYIMRNNSRGELHFLYRKFYAPAFSAKDVFRGQ